MIVSFVGGRAVLTCIAEDIRDGVVAIEWTVNGSLLEERPGIDIVTNPSSGFAILTITDLPLTFNSTEISCRIRFNSAVESPVVPSLLLLQGNDFVKCY